MKHIKTINSGNLRNTLAAGGCGECQTSCQSACKTSCTVANQLCENTRINKAEHARRKVS
jgi:predicted ribosomally synthesized six-cysteine peptide SCIFF